MGVVWGFLSALCFGSADFIARGVSVKLSAYHALFYIHLVSGVLLGIVVALDGIPSTATIAAVGLAVALGAVNTLGTLLLYRSLSIGKISLVSPITSTYGGVALILALLAGDAISIGGIFSLVLMLVGIVIVSIVRENNDSPDAQQVGLRGVPEAAVAAIALGINFWAMQFVVGPLGTYIPILIGRMVTVILLALLVRPTRQSIAVPPRELWLKIGAAGFVTTLGEVAYNVGVQGATPGIVAVVSSLFSPVTVLLALIFLHERMARHQWVGVGIIFIATLMLGIFQNFG
ncbi:MAG: DMT family transporter [Burkholderiales bacterium]|nr:DMT family transporter [Anaerolineae bacterium]